MANKALGRLQCRLWLLAGAALLAFCSAAPGQEEDQAPAVQVQLRAGRDPVLSSAMAGRISQIKVRDGDRFAAGDLLVRFDCAAVSSRLDRAKAQLHKRQRVYEVNSRLNQLESISQLELVVSEADVAEARAEVALGQTLVERCSVYAPFSGRAGEVRVQAHQFVAEGEPLLEILDDTRLEIEMIVPSVWLRWLAPGHAFEVAIDETGRTYAATVDRIAGKVDAVSHTIKVFGLIQDAADDLMAGMSGRALLGPPVRSSDEQSSDEQSSDEQLSE